MHTTLSIPAPHPQGLFPDPFLPPHPAAPIIDALVAPGADPAAIAQAHNLTLAQLAAFIEQPETQAILAAIHNLFALHRQFQADHLTLEIAQTLLETARAADNPTDKRLAATAALRALTPQPAPRPTPQASRPTNGPPSNPPPHPEPRAPHPTGAAQAASAPRTPTPATPPTPPSPASRSPRAAEPTGRSLPPAPRESSKPLDAAPSPGCARPNSPLATTAQRPRQPRASRQPPGIGAQLRLPQSPAFTIFTPSRPRAPPESA